MNGAFMSKRRRLPKEDDKGRHSGGLSVTQETEADQPKLADRQKIAEGGKAMDQDKKLIPVPGTERNVLPQAHEVGDTDPLATMEVTVYVRPKPMSPASVTPEQAGELPPQWRNYATAAQINDAFGADPADLDKVEAYATAQGLRI